MDAEAERRSATFLRHRVRGAAHRVVRDCEMLLADTAQPEWRLWREAIGEALLAGHQLRALVDRRFRSSRVVLSREEMAELRADLREPQHRIVQAMTSVLGLVPTDLDDELLLDDVRAIRDVALRLGTDATDLAPAAPAETALGEQPPAGRHDGGEHRTPRLLVVDDSEAPRKLLVRLLGMMGYDIVAAAGGLEAIAIAERESIDVIVSDIQMPECDGFEMLRRLKANAATRDIPVIVVSGTGDGESVIRCIELGAEDHLPKPFDNLLLQARVRASLDRKRLRDQELRYLGRVAQLTVAAQDVENSTYRPGSLENLAVQDDALGRLARVFDRVVSGWQSKEARLQRQVRVFREEIRRSASQPTVELQFLDGVDSFATGQLFAERYEIVDEIGRGGMGVVYRALDRELGEQVAVKVMRESVLRTDPELIERLKMEMRLARRITHPNVVRAHDFGSWEGMYFLTMEYVQGTTVESLLQAQGRLSVASTLAIGTQLAEALAVAHEQAIIHRDIKPANLLVDHEGVLKVTDFGLARALENNPGLTQHGAVVGTPQYMAPEQLFGNVVDERSDLFVMGAVLYECLTGLPPFDANTPTEIVAKLVDGPAVSVSSLVPDVPPAFSALIDKLLRYEPKERLQSARELIARLHELA